MYSVSDPARSRRRALARLGWGALSASFLIALPHRMVLGFQAKSSKKPAKAGPEPVYLTFDTGHMAIAPFVAEVLHRQDVRVTFFAANEATKEGDGALGSHWAPWWAARGKEGHALASHTFDHAYWRGDLHARVGEPPRFRVRPSAGAQAGRDLVWTADDYRANISRAADRLRAITGVAPLPLWRAPGGKHSPALLAAARAGGWAHVGWSSAGFLGDELPSETNPNDRLLEQALRSIGPGDILLAHLGIWSRRAPWAPEVLEPLITGLKAPGLRFATLREHPQFAPWIAAHQA